jgi:C4-dicarboxylate transporter DctM subunit
MSPLAISLVSIAAFIMLAFLGLPIAISLALVGFSGLVLLTGFEPALTLLGKSPFIWGTFDAGIPIALFVLMGNLTFRSGIGEELYNAGAKWLGRLPGGLAMATTVACTGFAGCTGSSMAAAATMGAIALPEMNRFDYSPRLSTGCVVAGGTLGILIPPSVPFIIYGMLTETSIGELFIAGIVPGILLSGLFLIMIAITCKLNPSLGPVGSSYSWRERLISLKGIWPMLVIFLLVICGLYFGIFSPSEAGAAGAFGALVVGLVRRKLPRSALIAALKDSLKLVGFLVTLLIGAMLFTTFLSRAGFSTTMAEWIVSLRVSPILILIAILLMYIPLGMFVDVASMTFLTIPVLVPTLNFLGFDLVWFGVMFVIMSEVALITPPVGLNVYTVAAITDVPMEQIFRGATPFIFVMLLAVVLVMAFPQIALFLPNLMA